MKRDYVRDILDILEKYNGCIKGFNRLHRMGKFHRSTLQDYLKDMEEDGFIKVTCDGKQVKKYCIANVDFKTAFRLRDDDLEAVEKDLKRTALKDNERYFLFRNHIRLTYHNFIIMSVMYLYAKYEKNEKRSTKELDNIRKKLWDEIEEKVSLLPLDEKTRLWRSFLKDPPKIISLDEYRKSDEIGL